MPFVSQTVEGTNPWGEIKPNDLMISKDTYQKMQTSINNFYINCNRAVSNVNGRIPSSTETLVISNVSRASFSSPGALNLTFGDFVDASTFNVFIGRIYQYNSSAKSNMVTLLKKYTPTNKNLINTNNMKVYSDDTIVSAELFEQLGKDMSGMHATFTASWTETVVEPPEEEGESNK